MLAHLVWFPLVMKGYGPDSPPPPACVAPFAVVSTSVGFRAVYDPNGNMVLRVEVSGTQRITYIQEYDPENRLVVVTNTVTGQVTRFVYDGDGHRVLRIGPEGTTIYMGEYYEVLYPEVGGSGNQYGPYEPAGVGTTAAEGGRCDLQCPDGKLDPVRCRCIYPTPEPTPTPGPGPTPTRTPTLTPTPTPMPTPTPTPSGVVTKYVTIQPIEIALLGHFVPGVGLRRHPSGKVVGEGRPPAAGPKR